MTCYNFNTLTARTLGAALLLSVPAVVAADHSDIVVQPSPALDQWQADTSQDLTRALQRRGTQYSRQPANNAIVQVTFAIGENGKPSEVEVYDGDGNWAANRIARRAVRTLQDLDQVPVSNPQNVQFLANIIFSDNERIHGQLVERLEQMEAERMASSGTARTYIALSN
jgi:hypothetical protein